MSFLWLSNVEIAFFFSTLREVKYSFDGTNVSSELIEVTRLLIKTHTAPVS
jgi:hypothetical protein